MTIINLKTQAGVKLVEFVGVHLDNHENGTVPASELILGYYADTGATVDKHGLALVPMTKAQYDDIVAFKGTATSRVAGEPYTPSPNPVDELTSIVSTLSAELDGRLKRLEYADEVQKYTSYKLDGTTISGFYGTRSKAICKYDLTKGYRFEQRPYTTDVEDSRHVVSLHTANLGIITFLAPNSGMAGAVELAMDNGDDIIQTPHTNEVIA